MKIVKDNPINRILYNNNEVIDFLFLYLALSISG